MTSEMRMTVLLCLLGCALAGCGGNSLEIRFHSDESCTVNGEKVDQKRLMHHLRDMQDRNARLDLKTAIVRTPWNGTDEQCARMESLAKRCLSGLGLHGDIDARRADNPYVAFLKWLAPSRSPRILDQEAKGEQ